MDTHTHQYAAGFSPTMLETEDFHTQSLVDSSLNPDRFSISYNVPETNQTLTVLSDLKQQPSIVDSSEPSIMTMFVEKDTCFDATETSGISSVVSSPSKERDCDDSSAKGNDDCDGCEVDVGGKSRIQSDCKSSSSSSEGDETDTAGDGETVIRQLHYYPYLHNHYYGDHRFSKFYNPHHPSFHDGLWGRQRRFHHDLWHQHPFSRDDGESWRREPPGFSVSMLKIEPTGVGAGLSNLGNTCFINAILQCFTHTVPLVKELRSCTHVSSSDGGCEEFCVLCALHEHVDISLKSSGKVLSPLKFFDNLTHISSDFRRYQQEDAHEFLQCLLDGLERCLDSDSTDSTGERISQEDNIVQKVFGGCLLSKLECCNCGQSSDKYEPLVGLSLEIEDVNCLQNAIESFTKVETIDDPEAKFKCENCEVEASRKKQLMVDQAPLVAIFHLKRFKSDGISVEKIGEHVDFPLELDLKPYTISSSNSNTELKYQLYALVVHNGFFPTSGHYFSYIRSSPETWHKLDDSVVVEVEEEFVLSQAAYILFYVKDGTPWFSNMMEIKMPSVDSCVSNTSPKSVLEHVEGESTTQNAESTATNIEDATTRDVEPVLEGTRITDAKDADNVEAILQVIQTNDKNEVISFNVFGESEQGGKPEGAPNVATNCSYLIVIDEEKSVQAVLNFKENDSVHDYKGIKKGGCHPSRNVSHHGKPEHRSRDLKKVANRVNCKRSARKNSKKSEATRRIQNMRNTSNGKKYMALLRPSEKKKGSITSLYKDSPTTRSRRKLLPQLNDDGSGFAERVNILTRSK